MIAVLPGIADIPLLRSTEPALGAVLLASLKEEGGPDVVFAEGDFYAYRSERGVWVADDPARLSRIVQGWDGKPVGTGDEKAPLNLSYAKVQGVISCARDQAAQPKFFAEAPKGLVFKNGFLKVTENGLELVPHSPDHRARAAYPFDFDPNGEPTQFLSFLGDIFRDDSDKLDRITVTGEFAGASALGIAPKHTRCLILVAEGGAGRSALVEILREAMPEGTVANVKPQQFTNANRRALLVGKRLNAVDECPSSAMLEADWFKQIVDGNPTEAEQKYRDPFTFTPQAGHLYLANVLPVTEHTEAVYRRTIVMTLTRKFHKDGTEIKDIAEQIVAAELPQIVSYLMRCADRLIKRDGYTIPATHEAEEMRWRQHSDAVALYVAERTVLSTSTEPKGEKQDWTQASTLYRSFKMWCEDTGHKLLANNTFGERLKALVPWKREDRAVFYRIRKRIPRNPEDPKQEHDETRPDPFTELKKLKDLQDSCRTNPKALQAKKKPKTR